MKIDLTMSTFKLVHKTSLLAITLKPEREREKRGKLKSVKEAEREIRGKVERE